MVVLNSLAFSSTHCGGKERGGCRGGRKAEKRKAEVTGEVLTLLRESLVKLLGAILLDGESSRDALRDRALRGIIFSRGNAYLRK